MASTANSLNDPWVRSGLSQKQQILMKRYFEALDAEPEKGAKDWANTFADDAKFVNGIRVIEGSKGARGTNYPRFVTYLQKISFGTRKISILERMAKLVPCRKANIRIARLRGF
jgi:hypothetical protein